MGTHGAGTRARALPAGSNTVSSTVVNFARRRPFNLSDWPVARRLFAVIVAALLMGVIFGGLRVADAESSAAQFSRVSQLANLGQKLTVLVNDLQNERDETLSLLSAPEPVAMDTTMTPFFDRTNAGVKAVQQASDIGGLPANIENDITTVTDDISQSRIGVLQGTLRQPQDVFSVIGNYAAVISDMIALADQVDQGVSDATLASDVQAYNALALAKEQASEQRGLLNYAFASPTEVNVSYWIGPKGAIEPATGGKPPTGFTAENKSAPTLEPNSEAALSVAYGQEFVDEHAFYQAATPAEAMNFSEQLGPLAVGIALGLEQNMFSNINSDYLTDDGTDTGVNVPGSMLVPNVQTLVYPPGPPPSVSATNPGASSGVLGFRLITSPSIRKLSSGAQALVQGQVAWDTGTNDELTAMQNTETLIAGNIATRAGQLQQAASKSALTYGIITVVVLLIVLLAALAVARSLVLPLRRLRAGALNIASVQLPERVKLLTESPDAAASMVVAPINVPYKDEIGEVARAFDQVHAEAVRLAGEQALLRSTFNAMFVNLSRRSQSLIERLARMIDNLEQEEADPDRLGHLFKMDHLVTRMRRNSENLLLLAGHENPRKWSAPVALADVARAAISEIEQYNRIALNIPPGIAVVGVAVPDVAHLLAELIENATIFSPKDTQVQVVMQELSSGGVLIEISDKGIGVSEARLADMNWRLDNPPTIDVSVSRHMGLFAVARLAERHRVRIRLRPSQPQGLSALVWLPDSIVERTSLYGSVGGWQSQPVGAGHNAQSAGNGRLLGGMPEGAVALARNGNGSGHDPSADGPSADGPRVAKGWFRGPPAAGGAVSTTTAASRSDGIGGAIAGAQQWSAPSSPSYDDKTSSAGLPVRTRKPSLAPDTESDNRATGGLPQRSDSVRGGPVPGGGSGTGSQPLPQRSPDQVRSRLAGFQRGTRRAETQHGLGNSASPGGWPDQSGRSDQSPRAGEGSER
jgi:signal transduction histidine kinase